MAQIDYLDVEYHLTGRAHAVLRCPDQQDYTGSPCIDDDLCQRLLELEHKKDFDGYGKVLFAAIFPVGGDLLRGIYSVLDGSLKLGKRLRFRLNIDSGAPSRMHSLHWELLTDGKDFEVGRSPETVFSRYVSQPYIVSPAPKKAKMLCVIAAPVNVVDYGMAAINYDDTRRSLDGCFAELQDTLEIDYLERPVRPEKLRESLKKGRYELLHIHGHGILPREKEAALVLEDAERRVKFTSESDLRGILLGLRDLKLVTLVACHGGEPSQREDHLSGLAGSLVKRKIPAVIAMRRSISMKDGFQFTRVLYRELAETPCVDAAINEARHRLYMANPKAVAWSSPVLYMRLLDGLLWQYDLGEGDTVRLPQEGEPRDGGAEVHQTPVQGSRFKSFKIVVVLLSLLVVVVLGWQFLQPVNDETMLTEEVDSTPVITDEARQAEEVDPPPVITNVPGDTAAKSIVQEPIKKPEPEFVPPPPPPPRPAFILEPIKSGKIGVGAIDSETMKWSGEVSRMVARSLRSHQPGSSPVVVSGQLVPKIFELIEGDFSILPGGDRSPEGFEYFFIIVQSQSPLPAPGTASALSVACEMILVSTRDKVIQSHQAASHTGMDGSRNGALGQAIGRCVKESQGDLS